MPSVVSCMPSVVSCMPSVVSCMPSVVSCMPSVVSCMPSVVSCMPSVVSCMPSVVSCMPSAAVLIVGYVLLTWNITDHGSDHEVVEIEGKVGSIGHRHRVHTGFLQRWQGHVDGY